MTRGTVRIKAFLSTVTILSLLFCISAVAFSAEIDDIKGAIKARKAKWNADTTTIHKLNQTRRKKRVGLLPPATSASVPEQTKMASPLPAPTGGFDWRDNGGTNYVTPIKDQGDCGSCWAFASTGALESYTQIHGTYNATLNLSEQILVSCSGAGSCNGGYLDSAASYIELTGLPPEKDDPYTATNSACSAAVSGWTSATDKVSTWEWISDGVPPTASTLKNALYTYGPLVVTMNVYSDFYAYKSGVYTYTTGTLEGGHAILLVGYADDTSSPGGGYFIVKNSWGTGWGEPYGSDPGGYFRIGYSELNSQVQFASFALAYDQSTPTCNYSMSPTNNTMSNIAGTGKISVTTGNSCVWLAKSGASWITLASSAAVTGNGSISYSVAANTASAARTGTITLTDKNSNVVGTFTLTQQAQPATYTITGTVKSNSSTGATIAGAAVSFAGQTATTAGNGTFSITGVTAGTYTLAISATGYTPYTSSITLNANQTIVAALTPASYTLTGTVHSGSPTGPGLAGATVAVAGKTATTAGDGTFSISGISGGTYTMVVSKTGYVSVTSQSVTINSNLVAALYLLPQTYTVSGTVTSAAGSNATALSGAVVSIAGQSATTGSTGTFSISGVAPGTYAVNASKSGYNTYSGSITVSANQTLSIVMTPTPVTYTLSGTIHTGSVTASDLAGATVSVAGKTATTASNGTFTISGVAAGTYTLAISATGYAPYTSSITLNANQTIIAALTPASYTLTGTVHNGSPTGPGLAGATVAVAGKTATTAGDGTFSINGISGGTYTMVVSKTGYVSVTSQSVTVNSNLVAALYLLPQTYTASGTVTSAATAGSNATALSGAIVSIAGQSTTSGSTGTFSISGLAPGTYPVNASKSGYNTYTGSITVNANQTLSIVMTPVTHTLSGTIHTGSMTGSGLSGATVSVAGKTATTASDGTFSIAGIPAGSYTYTVTKTGYVSYTSGTFTMSSDLVAATYLAPLPTVFTINGTVKSTTSSGPAIPGATVYLAGQTLTTGSNGTFSATGIAAGTYPINIVAQGYGIYSTNITISANQTLTFCMAPLSYTLSGTVTAGSLTGAGLAGATVSLAGQTATTNSTGSFSISIHAAAGIYTITASKSGYTTYTNNALSVGGNQTVNIALKPSTTTSGH